MTDLRQYADAVARVREATVRPVEADLLDFGPAPDDTKNLLLRVRLLGQMPDVEVEGLEVTQRLADGRLAFKGEAAHFDPATGELVVVPAAEHPIPVTGLRVRLEPPDYLKALAEFAAELAKSGDENRLSRFDSLRGNLLSHDGGRSAFASAPFIASGVLRPAQEKALRAAFCHPVSFVWGPPGTGKSYTLGYVVRELARAGRRVLVVSTTNAAVDVTTFAIDDAFAASDRPLQHGQLIRFSRVLTQVEKYRARSHLTAYTDLLAKLLARQQVLERKIAQADRELATFALDDHASRGTVLAEIAKLKLELADIGNRRKEEVKRLLDSARVVCATFTSTIYNGLLGKIEADVLVVDEASQMALACWPYFFAAFGSRFPRIVIAGDPCQLRPVCTAKDLPQEMTRWFTSNLYGYLGMETAVGCVEFVNRGVMTFLNEQSRMHTDICRRLSDVFYNGWLKGDCSSPLPEWPQTSDVPNGAVIGCDASQAMPITVRTVAPVNTDLRHVAFIVSLVRKIIANARGRIDVLVITPFRGQWRLLSRQLTALPKPANVTVRTETVHRAQGSEADVVIFDTVDPSHWFLNNSEAMHLWCVACSRAKSQLFVVGRPAAIAEGRYSRRLFGDIAFMSQ